MGERNGRVLVGLVEAGVKGVGLGDDALEPVVDPLGLPRVEVHLPGQGADLVPEGLELLGVGVRLADDRVGRVESGFQQGLLLPGRAGEVSDLGPQRGHLQALLGSRRHHLVKPGQPPGEGPAGHEVLRDGVIYRVEAAAGLGEGLALWGNRRPEGRDRLADHVALVEIHGPVDGLGSRRERRSRDDGRRIGVAGTDNLDGEVFSRITAGVQGELGVAFRCRRLRLCFAR